MRVWQNRPRLWYCRATLHSSPLGKGVVRMACMWLNASTSSVEGLRGREEGGGRSEGSDTESTSLTSLPLTILHCMYTADHFTKWQPLATLPLTIRGSKQEGQETGKIPITKYSAILQVRL